MMLRLLLILGLLPAVAGRAAAQLRHADFSLTVRFTLNGGATQTADRDVAYAISGSSDVKPLYRMAEGVEPTGGWSIASSSTIAGTMRLMRGPEGRRTIYLHIRRDAESPIVKREASIQLSFPKRDLITTDPDAYSSSASYLLHAA